MHLDSCILRPKKSKLNTFLTYLIIIHVIAGSASLLFGMIAFLLRSNTPKHKPIGRIYFWCMTVVFVSAIILSVAKSLVFFFFIAVFTYYSVAIAYRALRLKQLHLGQKPALIDWFIQIAAGLVFAGALILAGINDYQGARIIMLVFGAMGLWAVYVNSKAIFKGPKKTNYWLTMHLGNMLGSYIGAITAFLVNQSDKIPVNPLFLWLGPTVLLVPIITMELRKIKSEPL